MFMCVEVLKNDDIFVVVMALGLESIYSKLM